MSWVTLIALQKHVNNIDKGIEEDYTNPAISPALVCMMSATIKPAI